MLSESSEPSPIVAGIAAFAAKILASGADDPIGAQIPAVMRHTLEAALPMVVRQMSTIDPDELARGLHMFAEELENIARLGDHPTLDDVDARSRLA